MEYTSSYLRQEKEVNRKDFEDALTRFLDGSTAEGNEAVSITAGGLHRLVGGYPGPDHRMPVCCSVMRAAMHEGDRILNSPPKGEGPSLEVYYRLPRLGISVGQLRDALAMYPDDAPLFFGTGGQRSLTFYRVKNRGLKDSPLVQVEFNELYKLDSQAELL